MYISYNDAFNVGVYRINNQHDSIIKSFNKLIDLYKVKNYKQIKKQLKGLEFLIFKHFKLELRYLDRFDILHKKSEDLELMSCLISLSSKVISKNINDVDLIKIKKKIINIIMVYDKELFKQYHDYYNNKNFLLRLFSKI